MLTATTLNNIHKKVVNDLLATSVDKLHQLNINESDLKTLSERAVSNLENKINRPLTEVEIFKMYAEILNKNTGLITEVLTKDYVNYVEKVVVKFSKNDNYRIKNLLVELGKNLKSVLNALNHKIVFNCNTLRVTVISEVNNDKLINVLNYLMKNKVLDLEAQGLAYVIDSKLYSSFEANIKDNLDIDVIKSNEEKNDKLEVNFAINEFTMREKTNERLNYLYQTTKGENPKLLRNIKYVPNKGYFLPNEKIPLLIGYTGIARTDFNVFIHEFNTNSMVMYEISKFLSLKEIRLTKEEKEFIVASLKVANNHRKRLDINNVR